MITSNYKHSTKNRTSLYKFSYSNFALFIAFRLVHCLLQFYKGQIPCFIFSPWQMHLTVPARLRAWIDAMLVERFPQITIVADITDLLLHQPCVDQVRNLYRFQHSRQAHKLQGVCLVAHEAELNLSNPVFVLRRSLHHILQDILPIHLDAHVLIENEPQSCLHGLSADRCCHKSCSESSVFPNCYHSDFPYRSLI